jgi:TetR/AcrR family transcriptional regulator, transcriptional repressor for nem operon
MKTRHGSAGGAGDLHQQILDAAGPFLKRHGIDGAPVDEIMKEAGLTSGALYSHFKNKDDLCAQAVCRALDAMLDAYRTVVRERGRDGVRLLIAEYLSQSHASNASTGCALAALGSDLAKASPRARRLYQLRIQALVQILVDGLGLGSPAQRRARAEQILSTMLGAVTFARAMSDAEASAEFLSHVRSRVLRDLEEEEQ